METETETESTKIWNSLFSELLEAENGLSEAVQILNYSVNSKSLKIPTEGYKTEDWRNLHNKISKNSKTIEKLYSGYTVEEGEGTGSTYFSNNSSEKKYWNEAISETLVREGFSLNKKFGENIQSHGKAYAQLSQFVANFEKDPETIFEWIKLNFPDSNDKENLLAEFTQYLFFCQLKNNNIKGALVLIRNQMKNFKNSDNQKLINKLLVNCLFISQGQGQGQELTRQLRLVEQPKLANLKEHFVKSYCKCLKIPKYDPLSICNELGTKSIPPLDRLSSLFKGKNYSALTSEEELPIELQVDEEFVFHSIFCCPVIKQQSSESNPAFLLPCSHAISKEALNRLSKGNSLVRFKCPYCPSETNFSNCLQLNF